MMISSSLEELQIMLNKLSKKSNNIVLKLNIKKTKYMTSILEDAQDQSLLKIGDEEIEEVEDYIYLEQRTTKDKFR